MVLRGGGGGGIIINTSPGGGNDDGFSVEISCDNYAKSKLNDLLVEKEEELLDCLIVSKKTRGNSNENGFPTWLISKFKSWNTFIIHGSDKGFNPYRLRNLDQAKIFTDIINEENCDGIHATIK